jgi:hypothetical protein
VKPRRSQNTTVTSHRWLCIGSSPPPLRIASASCGEKNRRSRLQLGRQRLRAVVKFLDAQHRANARQQRAVVDRLREVLIAAGLEPGDHVLGLAESGHEDDRRERKARIGAQPSADLDAVEPRHHDVEQDEIGRRLARGGQRLLAVGRGDDVVAGAGEPRLQDLHVRRVVVDDEDARRRSQAGPPAADGESTDAAV